MNVLLDEVKRSVECKAEFGNYAGKLKICHLALGI